MNLKQSFDTVVSEIESKRSELSIREEELKKREVAITAHEKEISEKVRDLESKIKEFGGVEKAKEVKGEYERKTSELVESDRDIARRRGELISWENRLFLIEQKQKAKEVELSEKESRLSKEKETYKEELKSQFLETLKKQFPQ